MPSSLKSQLATLASKTSSFDEFKSQAENLLDLCHAESMLTTTPLQAARLPTDRFSDLISKPGNKFNYERYYQLQEPSREELSIIIRRLRWGDPVNKQFVKYLLCNHSVSLLSLANSEGTEEANLVLQLVLKLPLSVQEKLPIWNCIPPSCSNKLFFDTLENPAPHKQVLKTTFYSIRYAILNHPNVAPILPLSDLIPFYYRNSSKLEPYRKNLAIYLKRCVLYSKSSVSNLHPEQGIAVLELLDNGELTPADLSELAFSMPYGPPKEFINLLKKLLYTPETSDFIQERFYSFIVRCFNQFASKRFLSVFKIEFYTDASCNSILCDDNFDAFIRFILTHCANKPKELGLILKQLSSIPIEFVSIPGLPKKLVIQTLYNSTNLKTDTNCGIYKRVFSNNTAFLYEFLQAAMSHVNSEDLYTRLIALGVRIPLNQAVKRNLVSSNPALIRILLKQYPTYAKHPSFQRIIAFNLARYSIDCSFWFSKESYESKIIHYIMASPAA
jgi:hypothetical protein